MASRPADVLPGPQSDQPHPPPSRCGWCRTLGIWTAQAAGPGTQTLTWAAKSGNWMVVVMNADGSRPVSVQLNGAATLPALPWIATGLLVAGFACLVSGVLLIAVRLRRAPGPEDTRVDEPGRWA